jgi:hypothetical protein
MLTETYYITASSDGYQDTQIVVSLNNTFQTANFYMNPLPTEQITFYIIDNENNYVSGATISITLNINGTVVTIMQKNTDISGSSIFGLDPAKEYGLVVSKTGYVSYTGVVIPIQDTYTINIQKDGSEIFQSINEDFALAYYLVYVPGSDTATIKYQTTSISGDIVYFGASALFNGTTTDNNVSGTPGGGTILLDINLSGITSDQYINATFWYKLGNGVYTTWDANYYLAVNVNGNHTIASGLFENDGMDQGRKTFIGLIILTIMIITGYLVSRNMTLAAVMGIVGLGICWYKELFPALYTALAVVSLIVLIMIDNLGGR